MSQSLNGKSALITGSTSGIGSASAQRLAQHGAHVIVSGRNTERGAQTVEAIRAAGGKADFVQADLSGAAGARELATAANEATGGIDILVNNAGLFPFIRTDDTSEQIFDEVYDVNVKAPFFLTASVLPAMAAKGSGSVINIGTAVSRKGIPGATAYASSKAALDQLTRIWAAEYGPAGVRVNSVLPGATATEGVVAAVSALGDKPGPELPDPPLGRIAQPEDIAAVVAFLASEDAAYLNGAFIAVDGGFSIL